MPYFLTEPWHKQSEAYIRRFLAFLCAGLLLFSCLSVVSTAEPFTQREEFYFGVTGHPRHYEAYPERQLPEQIRLAAQLGSDLYRINSVPVNRNDFAYLDRVLALCSSYDMDMMLVLDSFPGETEQEIYENGKAIAAHFGQRLAFVQAGNELTNSQKIACELNGDSTVNAKDALLILRYAVKKIDQFPIESTT